MAKKRRGKERREDEVDVRRRWTRGGGEGKWEMGRLGGREEGRNRGREEERSRGGDEEERRRGG